LLFLILAFSHREKVFSFSIAEIYLNILPEKSTISVDKSWDNSHFAVCRI